MSCWRVVWHNVSPKIKHNRSVQHGGCNGRYKNHLTRDFALRQKVVISLGYEKSTTQPAIHNCSIGNDLYPSSALVQTYNQSITYIRSSSNVSGFMQLSPTKLVYCLDLLGIKCIKADPLDQNLMPSDWVIARQLFPVVYIINNWCYKLLRHTWSSVYPLTKKDSSLINSLSETVLEQK
jgi:hypothetical protein